MRAKIAYLLYKVRTGLWFLPAAMTLAAVVLSQVLRIADAVLPAGRLPGLQVLQIGAEGARLLMSTIAGSMMTVTSLVFSLTLIALTMTSSQFGPRLLPSFMRDRVTQVVLGVFLATFVYSLVILGSIPEADDGNVVPSLSIAVGMVMAMGSFGVLIYFIHHIASTIQADTIISKVTTDLHRAIEEQFPPSEEDEAHGPDTPSRPEREAFAADAAPVRAAAGGYVQAIDHATLLQLAEEHDVTVWLNFRAGHFLVAGEAIAMVKPAERASDEVLEAVAGTLVVGRAHTMVQDLEYTANAIVEIALRALSPGINDPYTAIACIDNISAALAKALERKPPSPVLFDGDGTPRIFLATVDFAGLLDTAFNEIRQNATDKVSVIIRLLEALIRIAPFATRRTERIAIAEQAEMIRGSYEDRVPEPLDRADIERRVERLAALLAE